MYEFLNNIIDSSTIPVWTALLLGVLTSISPCPLATNITAISFLSRDIKTAKNTMLNASAYILGRMTAYTALATMIYFGLSSFTVSSFFQRWGEKSLGPILIILGLYMFGFIKLNFISRSKALESTKLWLAQRGYLGSFGIGLLFALAFCPLSAVLFFGILIPLILSVNNGLILAPAFAIGTGLPVAIFSILTVISIKKMSEAYKAATKVEQVLRYLVSSVFVLVGLYYSRIALGLAEVSIFYPFQAFAEWLTYSVFNVVPETHFAHTLEFFIFDFFKIIFLLLLITHVVGIIQVYLPIEKIKDFLAKKKLFGLDYFLATVFGAITPFCSCSSIPLFMGFVQAGIPLGVTFTFLVTSPLINEVAIALFAGIFGWKITLIYIAAGMFVGIIGGMIISLFKMEKYVIQIAKAKPKCACANQKPEKRLVMKHVSHDAFTILKKILPYLFIGIGLGAAIHGYVPEAFFAQYLEGTSIWSVPLATIFAVPMYTNASGVIPVIQSFVAKGVPLGTALSFMMAVVALSLPEAIMLKRILKWQLIALYFGIMTISIILLGYFFNIVL